MTLYEAGKKALKYANRYSAGGYLLAGKRVQDYNNKRNTTANDAQQDLARIAKIDGEFVFTRNSINPIPSSNFDIKQHLNDDVILCSGTNVHAYHFMLDGESTIYVEEETATDVWTTLALISVPGSVSNFVQYKGVVTPDNIANTVRIRASGFYPYNIKSYALWNEIFKSNLTVPDYMPFVEYDLPTDFMELNESIQINDKLRVILSKITFDKPNKRMIVPYDLIGEVKVYYYKTPTEIDENTAENYVFELTNSLALTAIPYYMAGMMIAEDIGDMSNFCMQIYGEYKIQIEKTKNTQNNVKQVECSMWKRRSSWFGS